MVRAVASFVRDTVFHPKRLWRQIIIWPVVSGIVFLDIGTGVGLLGMNPPPLHFVEFSFISSAVILLAKVIQWLVTEQASRIERVILSFVIFGVVGMALTEALHYVKARSVLVSVTSAPTTPQGSDSTSKPSPTVTPVAITTPLPSPSASKSSGNQAGERRKRRAQLLRDLHNPE